MTFLDASVIIDYLDGVDDIVTFVDEQEPPFRTSSVCVYEVLAGEVFSQGETDIEATRQAFDRIHAVEFTEETALDAARLQQELLETREPMSPRDLFVAATAWSTGDRLVIADTDFDTDGLTDLLPVTNLSSKKGGRF